MKITPLEIRQKSFEKKLRGYDKEEVAAFLVSLSNEWERVLDENKELRIKLDQAQKEVQKLREVESSLFKTLKTAEDTGANVIDQANKAAELHLREAQINAEALMGEAKSKAKNVIEKAEQEARSVIEEMQDAVKELERNYRSVENHQENVLGDLKNLAMDLLEKIEKSEKHKKSLNISSHTKRVKELVRESEEMVRLHSKEVHTARASTTVERPSPERTQKETAERTNKAVPASSGNSSGDGSFFDKLDD